MGQTTQQISQKPLFPIKTKIAAWWMIIFGAFLLFLSIKWFLTPPPVGYTQKGLPSLVYLGFLLGLLYLFLSTFILKRKKTAWIILVLIIFISGIFGLINLRTNLLALLVGIFNPALLIDIFVRIGLGEGDFSGIFIFLLIPFILLLLDRKNFFKIAL